MSYTGQLTRHTSINAQQVVTITNRICCSIYEVTTSSTFTV